MAVHAHAAASLSPDRTVFSCFLSCKSQWFCTYSSRLPVFSVFPKMHIDFPTRGNNTLDFVYTTQRGANKTLPLPHLGASDHITVMLMPAYRPLVKVIKPIHKQIQVWPEGSSEFKFKFKFYLSHTRLYRDCITSSEM